MILVPDSVWDRMLAEFRRVRRSIERVTYLDGTPLGEGGVVTTLTLPDAILEHRRYHVRADAMSQAGQHLRAFGMVRLAQVHTHGNAWVGHSTEDDRRAYSQHHGALSIVLPYHAQRRPSLADAGVHVRDVEGWRHLEPEELSGYVRMVPAFLDFRRP